MTVSLQTHDRQHYLCAEADGRVVADREQVGAWEEWTIDQVPGGWSLLSAHGRYLCAELDGSVVANREGIGPWETWRLVADAQGVAFQSHHGGFLVAEMGGGREVTADRFYSGPGPWETFTPSAPIGSPAAPPAVVLSPLTVEDNRRYFHNASGRFQWREVSAFSCLARILRGEGETHVRPLLRAHKAGGFTLTRQILTLWGDYWADFLQGPTLPGYWAGLDYLARMHAEEGLYMRACFLGALDWAGGQWDESRRDIYQGSVRAKAEAFVLEAVDRLKGYPHIVGELANEPDQIGMRDSWPAIVELGRKVKRLAPAMLLCAGEDNQGRGAVAPFDFADAHLPRDMGVAGWQWIKRAGEHPVADQAVMPFVAGENVNMGEARRDGKKGDVESQPANCFGAAAVSRARKWGGICFHGDFGLWTTPLQPVSVDCARAFHAALDAFPMRTDNMWRGQWGLNRGDYWRDTFPDSDDLSIVERHVRDGRGPWRAFGCGAHSVVFPQPKGWDWRRCLDAPAERVAFNDQGVFDVAVYKRV